MFTYLCPTVIRTQLYVRRKHYVKQSNFGREDKVVYGHKELEDFTNRRDESRHIKVKKFSDGISICKGFITATSSCGNGCREIYGPGSLFYVLLTTKFSCV